MTNFPKINPSIRRFLSGGSDKGMVRIPPEPKSRLGVNFGSILSNVGAMVGSTLGAVSGGIQPQYMELINKQLEMQEQMQLVSLHSNILKSQHESQMAAIRNIRAG